MSTEKNILIIVRCGKLSTEKNSSIAKTMRKIFVDSLNLLEKNRQDKNFILPAVEKEYFVLYATDFKDAFYLEPIFNNEILEAMSQL